MTPKTSWMMTIQTNGEGRFGLLSYELSDGDFANARKAIGSVTELVQWANFNLDAHLDVSTVEVVFFERRIQLSETLFVIRKEEKQL